MRQLAQAIIDIYASPGSSELLDKSIQTIEQLYGGYCAYLLVNLETSVVACSAYPSYPDSYAEKYISEANEKDIRLKYAHKVIPGKAYRDFEYIPDMNEYDRSEWIQYQLNTLGIYHSMVAYISPHGLWADYVTLNRSKELGAYTCEEKELLQKLLPHLARAAEINRWVKDLQTRYRAVLSVLDKLLVGLIILDKQGRIVIANEKARNLSDISGTFSFTQTGQMKIFDEDKQSIFKKMTGLTGNTASGLANCDGGQIVLKNRSDGESILLEIMPLRDDGFCDSDKISGTAIFILDPSQSQLMSADALTTIFKLTQSESLITHALINGMSINKIAEERGTSNETVRGQVKQVFSKTGARSQLDLLRLAVKVRPPVEK